MQGALNTLSYLIFPTLIKLNLQSSIRSFVHSAYFMVDTISCKNNLFLSDTHKLNVKETKVTFSKFCNSSGKAKV